MKRHLAALISAALLFGACSSSGGPGVDDSLGTKEQSGLTWNGLTWNGLTWNGLTWNGLTWNGLTWNGLGWTGFTWYGMGWTGSGFSNTSVSPNWGLDTWVNHSDADGVGGITSIDRDQRLSALAYWVGCACGASDNLAWTGDNPYLSGPHPHNETVTFQGNFGLAPTWCTGTAAVPVDEQQAVSACIFARINANGIHNAVSMRGYNTTLQLVDNEKLFMAYPEGEFFGNMWDTSPEIYDPVEGNFYPRSMANACYYPWGNANAQLAHDLQTIMGRTCEWNGCGGPLKTSQACFQDGTADGSYSTGHDTAMNPVMTVDPPVGATGLNNSYVNGYQDSRSGLQYATWHNNSWRKLSTFLGDWADLEVENWKPDGYRCSTDCPQMDGCGCYGRYCNGSLNGEPGQEPVTCEYPSECNICSTIVTPVLAMPKMGSSAACLPAANCVRGRKLTGLTTGSWLRIMFMRPFDLLSNTWVTGVANPHKAGTVRFRYSNPTGTTASILFKDLIRNTLLDGSGFVPTTGGWDDFDNHDIYPIYPGRSSFTATTPGIDLAIASDPTSLVFPNLDYVQMWVGPPFGVQPREQYDDGGIGKGPILEGGNNFASTQILVGADGFKSDFAQAHNVRIRLGVTHPKPSELKIQLIHGKTTVTIQGASLDPNGWSQWVPNFGKDDPSAGPWQIRVYDTLVNGSKGTLNTAVVEFQQ